MTKNIYRERERERERENIYIYIYRERERDLKWLIVKVRGANLDHWILYK